MQEKLQLVFPTAEMEKELLGYKNEFLEEGKTIHGSAQLGSLEFDEWFNKINSDLNLETVSADRVPATQFCSMIGDKIIGMIQVRHTLNDYLFNFGGHIGYSVRKSERRKGYATRQLELALEKCKEMGIDKVLITCNDDNDASRATIKKCGGIFENTATEPNGKILERWWITL